MHAEENKNIVRRLIEEGTNHKDLAVFDELVAHSFVDHEARSQFPAAGPEAEKKLLTSVAEAFPDWRWDIQEMLAVEDKVITRYVARGTHLGEFMSAAPTGREVEVGGINIVSLEGEKIVESWGNSDQLGWLRQLGVIPDEARF